MKKFEEQQKSFEQRVKKFDENVVYNDKAPDISEYKQYYDCLLYTSERRDETKLLTSLGEICYSRTYFHNKETGEYCYLLDRLMGLESHARISEDAVESSYRKGGINACIGEQEVSKETVMNKLHTLEFPLLEPLKEKRRVSRLYILSLIHI